MYLIIRNKVLIFHDDVATGDRSNVLAVIGAMLTSVAAGVFFFRKKRD